jgi:Putative Flp pilus-assembly TadE/G-like
MSKGEGSAAKFSSDRGVSILITAVAMIFVLGMAGLGIDLASLYVARNQAQRAADAAALAGAQWWATHACTSPISSTISLDCQANARLQAQAVGEKNPIAGVMPDIDLITDITFPSLSTSDPQIRVVAARNTAHNNAMPTFFVRIFGITSANISASATAEAYNGTNGSAPVGSKCVKPWLLPDCDANTTLTDPNTYCRDSSNNVNGGHYSSDPSIVGQLISIKPGSPKAASAPSEFYPVYVQGTSNDTASCPSCAKTQTSTGSNSGDYYRSSIECCVQEPIVCGTNTVSSVNGNMVGPTNSGVQCLIQQGNGNSGGQDIYDPVTGTITAGTSNRYGLTGPISNSDSIITIPIYNGQILCPGGSTGGNGLCQTSATITVTGFMKVFIQKVDNPQATVYAYVMSITTCSAGGSGGGGTAPPPPIIAAAGTPVPVRLIHQ